VKNRFKKLYFALSSLNAIFIIFLYLFISSACSFSSSTQNSLVQCHSKIYDNGFEVVYYSNPRLNNTSVVLEVRTGRYDDPKEYKGLTHLLEHGFNHAGCYKDFNGTVLKKGGAFEANTSSGRTLYKISNTGTDFKYILRQIKTFLAKPTFNENDIKQDIKVIASERELNRSNQLNVLLLALQKKLPTGHPFFNHLDDNLEYYLDRTDELQETMISFHQQHYRPEKMTLFIVSNVASQELEREVDKILKDFIQKGYKNKGDGLKEDFFTKLTYDGEYIIMNINEIDHLYSLLYLIPLSPHKNRSTELAAAYYRFQLNRKEPTSLYRYFRESNLAFEVSAEDASVDGDNAFLIVNIETDDNGYENRLKIEKALLEYLLALKTSVEKLKVISLMDSVRLSEIKNEKSSAKAVKALMDFYTMQRGGKEVKLSAFLDPLSDNELQGLLDELSDFSQGERLKAIKFALNYDKNKKSITQSNKQDKLKEKPQPFIVDARIVENNELNKIEPSYSISPPQFGNKINGIKIWKKAYPGLGDKVFLGLHLVPVFIGQQKSQKEITLL